MTAPFVPPDLDLRDFDYMPLLVETLPKSDIVIKATAEEFRAAVLLWCACWHEVPASSLPNDDSLLARAAGYGFNVKGWMKVKKGALRNFEICDDGRLYHPVIADLAIKARQKKRDDADRTKNATEARRRRNKQRERQRDDERHEPPDDERNVHQGKGREDIGHTNVCPADDVEREMQRDGRQTRGTRIPLEFSPDAARLSKAHDLGFREEEIRECVREFVNYWSDIPGSRGLRVNWQGTFENRLVEMAGRKKTSNGKYNIRDSIDTALQFRRSEEARRSGGEGSNQDPALLPGLRKGSA